MPNPISLYPGFMGKAIISDTTSQNNFTVRCTDFNVNVSQELKVYNHIIGLRDSIPTSMFNDKKDDAKQNPQNIMYRAGIKACDGNISFPITNVSGSSLFVEAVKADDFTLDFDYTCNKYRQYKPCKVNTYSLSATAGEVPRVTAGIKAVKLTQDATGTYNMYNVDEKLLTWDAIAITGLSGNILSFQIDINNNCTPIYTAGTNMTTGDNLWPLKIRVGLQQVSGYFTFYWPSGLTPDLYIEDILNIPLIVNIDMGGIFKIKLNIIFPYPEISGKLDAMIRTYKFVGVDKAIDIGV